jgi:hypothetical protein
MLQRKKIRNHGPLQDPTEGPVALSEHRWYRQRTFPARLRHYRRTNTTGVSSVAEVLEATLKMGDQDVRVELMAETDGSGIEGGAILDVRMSIVGG